MKKILYLISSLVALTLVSCEKETLPENVVDLGLSVKWSTINVGAINPEDYGYYFAWGEFHQNENCNWETYKWFNKDNKSLTKYCVSSESGTVDNKTVLDLEDDVASIRWGDNWRMPTKEEFDELINNCTAKIVGYDLVLTSNVEGYRDCYISFPIGGYTGETVYGGRCYYWSSTLSNEETDINNNYSISGPFKAYCLQVNNSIEYPCYTTLMNRSYGFYVRPVRVSIK